MGTTVFKKGDQMSVEAKNAKQLIVDEIKEKFEKIFALLKSYGIILSIVRY